MIIDLHCDSLMYVDAEGRIKGTNTPERMRSGGVTAQCFAIFTDLARVKDPYAFFCEKTAVYERMLEKNPEFARALSPADVRENRKNKRISAILTAEDGDFLKGELSRLDEAHGKGVRMIALTWNHPNCLGFPNSDDPALHSRGLTAFGRDAVERMNELGIIVDVSHLSEGGFRDVAEITKKPFAASHSCARALCDHRRNLSDEQLKIIGEKGGVVGVNFYARFLRSGAEVGTAEMIAGHARYIADKAGIDAVALGSDFDGIETPVDFADWRGADKLLSALSRCFTDGEIEKITFSNFMRVWEEQ